ncbi:hypothetical protein N9B82_06610 [Saprospiraceae bacterium]|nr:hypothetical protein [Saprospiraceae bacterium]
MKFQIKEKTIYSESDLLHFGEKEIFGDIVNTHFPDYTGISVGSPIYQSADKDEIDKLKKHLEMLRMRSLDEMTIAFFDDDQKAREFYGSKDFTNLQALYKREFDLVLIKEFHMKVVDTSFYIPPSAKDKQIQAVQKLLNLYFYYVEEVSEQELLNTKEIDWQNRLSILYQENKQGEDSKDHEELIIDNVQVDNEQRVRNDHEYEDRTAQSTAKQKPWWKFW